LISATAWTELREYVDVFVVAYEGVPVAAHVLLVDRPRARLFLSATTHRADAVDTQVVGRLNRLLHWHEMLYYKACGFAKYDFGGIEDRSSPVYSVTQFKLSFGGDVVDELTLALAAGAPLRRLLSVASRSRDGFTALRNRRRSAVAAARRSR